MRGGRRRKSPSKPEVAASAKWPHRRREDARHLLQGHPVVFDTMILTAIVGANRTQMLVQSMSGRARIPDAVAGELRGHSRGEPALTSVMPPPNGSFGQLVKDRQIAQTAHTLQRAWRGAKAISANPKIDRGEAECLAACKVNRNWALFSQDHRAVLEAPKWGIYLYGLPELLMFFAAEGRCLPASAWKIYAGIAGAEVALVCQHWPVDSSSEATFTQCFAVLTAP